MFYIGIVSEGMWWRNNAAGLMNAAFRISMMNGRSCRLSFRQKTSESCFVGVQCAHYLEPDYQSGTRSHFWRGETDLWGSVSATLYAFFPVDAVVSWKHVQRGQRIQTFAHSEIRNFCRVEVNANQNENSSTERLTGKQFRGDQFVHMNPYLLRSDKDMLSKRKITFCNRTVVLQLFARTVA